MNHKTSDNQMDFPDFYLPFNGKLNPENRWVILAKLTPWDVIKAHYQGELADSGMGAPAMNGRMAFGAFIMEMGSGREMYHLLESGRNNAMHLGSND
jgi:IS5 family transposase